MKYKQIVNAIKNLRWERLSEEDLQKLMILSAYAAVEFAESLQIALKIYPENEELRQMARGELNTDNLRFMGYTNKGNHADFLKYFIDKHALQRKISTLVSKAGEKYLESVRKLPKEVRAMSIFSREQELPGIFERILEAKNWKAPGLAEFRYYLEKHILLDSKEGGHADLVEDFLIDDRMKEFYKIRMEMYRIIPKLFKRL
jgi:hypothetical protein